MLNNWSHDASRRRRAGAAPSVRQWGHLAFLLCTLGASSASAQVFQQPTKVGAIPFVSASGTLAVGFQPIHAVDQVEATSHLPANVDVQGRTRALMERMWQASSTFRRQCARLAEASVTVTVEVGFAWHDYTRVPGPMTTIRRVGEQLTATVRLGGGQYDYSAYVAHEIEHILEQVDGVDLPSALARGVRGVHRAGDATIFETDRAILVGRLVAREVNGER